MRGCKEKLISYFWNRIKLINGSPVSISGC
jgi:hypothetical protein